MGIKIGLKATPLFAGNMEKHFSTSMVEPNLNLTAATLMIVFKETTSGKKERDLFICLLLNKCKFSSPGALKYTCNGIFTCRT